MQRIDDVLALYHDRGSRGLPLERVFRQLFNPEWYLRAYGKIYRNVGATTKGVTRETVDGMSLERIQQLIEQLRSGRFRWTPVRREHIPKPKGGTRPLGIPVWNDKLLQEVLRTLLEAFYEPQFRNSSHGFRPRRGCHTALYQVQTWTGTKWFIEGDISKCFDRISHDILLNILREQIHDERMLRLVAGLLKAGFLEDGTLHATASGTPQGGVASPLLANIYLNELDKFVEDELIPAYTRGKTRRMNPEYQRLQRLIRAERKGEGNEERIREWQRQRRQIPSGDTRDPGFRRLKYVRYADDFLLGFIGSKQEAIGIRDRLASFLQQTLRLELSVAKTLITHGGQHARFLGYEVTVTRANSRLDANGQRQTNGVVSPLMPVDVVRKVRRMYSQRGEVAPRRDLVNETDYVIVSRYQAVLRGIYNYYSLAPNVSKRMDRIRWILQTSLLKTMAWKYRTSVPTEFRRLRSWNADGLRILKTTQGRRGREPLTAEFGGLAFNRQKKPLLDVDRWIGSRGRSIPWEESELITRLLTGRCEVCGSCEGAEVHHIRKLADLIYRGNRPSKGWKHLMYRRRRKTLVLCRECHLALHAGQLDETRIWFLSRESRVQ
jgi:group II intron reverse transcriptase/maturase